MRHALIVAACVGLATPAFARPDLSTVAEKSSWIRTGRYDEVLRLCADFPRAYPGRVRCEKFGVSPEGRAMVALVAGKAGAPTLLFQGGIHAGEIDGKDAGFFVLRQFLDGKLSDAGKVRLVFVPVFNVDGHERFGAHNRPNQIGPVESGWRTTAQNLNLNRDYMKAQAPELRAMLRLLGEYDPIVYVDLHVTDGAEFQHDVAVLIEPAHDDASSPPLTAIAQAARALRQRLVDRLTAGKHLPLGELYPSFVREDDPTSGIAAPWTEPRFSTAYWALRDRVGILVETHSWKDYATRVRATRDVLTGLIAELQENGPRLQQLERAADAEAIAGRTIVLAMKEDRGKPRMIDFLGYAFKRVQSAVSGTIKIVYDPGKPQTWHIPFYDVLVPTLTVTAPRAGYVVPAAWADVVKAVLDAHGISYSRLTNARTLPLSVFRATDVKLRDASFEGRAMATIKGAWTTETRALAPGALYVPVAQPRARVAVALLEPVAPDSLAAWGFFNGVFERKEYMEDYVLEDVAEKMLADPAVKAEFDARLKDPAFAQSPRARLDFFYRRHPSWDEQLNLIPVYRVDAAP